MTSEVGYDVAIIGGGIVGCSILFELTRQGYKCILCESQPHIMHGASAGNSGMLHTGFDAPLGSLELQCITQCQNKIFDILPQLQVPFEKCGAFIVAWTSEEVDKLSNLLKHSHAAGIKSASLVTAHELYRAEPSLSQGALAALYVPDEAILDSNLLGVCFAHHAKIQNAKIFTNCTVTGFRNKTVSTSKGSFKANVTINCAGLHGDSVDILAEVKTFDIKPRKGQYCVFGKVHRPLLNSMVFPVPNEKTKGAVLFRSVYGNMFMGPTAEETDCRSPPAADSAITRHLLDRAYSLLPALKTVQVVGNYVGVRPATQWKDYQIKTYPLIGWMTVGGIRSTGVSGSLGIAEVVNSLMHTKMQVEPSGEQIREIEKFSWKVSPDRQFVVIDDNHSYKMAHPMFQFGHASGQSRL